ncbi:MAG TPA: DUF3558 domain-containing protein [Actinophytocola sp.]|uniref:DUF3558 domain-containing protein n=1 Tax=Actinophytocola sp. TaxID=1872138 RepID=UPI002DBEE09F|nr:DUF3558 domain-containing protein [Actinophytocola sp.]HEU5469459.1 DUF3558 domain-containing protein [Actinophytocola sp.]
MSRSAHWRRSALVVAALIAAAACTPAAPQPSDPTGSPPPSRATSVPRPSTPLPSTPPSITRTLDATAYQEKPCELFPVEQAAALGFPRPGRDLPDYKSNECGLLGDDLSRLTVRYYFGGNQVNLIYRGEAEACLRAKEGGRCWPREEIRAITIAGQPGVSRNVDNKTDHCVVAVGLDAQQSIEVRLQIDPGGDDACVKATAIAEVVVRKLGG